MQTCIKMNCHIKRFLAAELCDQVTSSCGPGSWCRTGGRRPGAGGWSPAAAQPGSARCSGCVWSGAPAGRGTCTEQPSLPHPHPPPATRLPVAVGLHGPLHDEEPGQQVDEDPPHPGRHQVGLGRAEVDVEHHDRHADAATPQCQ